MATDGPTDAARGETRDGQKERTSEGSTTHQASRPVIGSASVVALDDVATGRVLSPERLAGVAGTWADTLSRVAMVVVICVIFVWLNHRVMAVVQQAFEADLQQLATVPPRIHPDQRLVTADVLMALIGATVVQVGIAVVSIVSYLFPKADRPPR